MSTGATDGRYLRNAGIPTYGHSGLAADIFDFRAHGKDERVQLAAFHTGHQYLYELSSSSPAASSQITRSAIAIARTASIVSASAAVLSSR